MIGEIFSWEEKANSPREQIQKKQEASGADREVDLAGETRRLIGSFVSRGQRLPEERILSSNAAGEKGKEPGRIDKESVGMLKERGTDKGIVQEKHFNTRRDDKVNLIAESVYNLLINGNEENICCSDLVIMNSETGKSFDLNRLLPEGFVFTPREMNFRRYFFDKKSGLDVFFEERKNLKNYQGTKGGGDDAYGFFLDERKKIIGYGDLSGKGGMLALVHEIVHAWQTVHYGHFGEQKFDKFFQGLIGELKVVCGRKKKFGNAAAEMAALENRFGAEIMEENAAGRAAESQSGYHKIAVPFEGEAHRFFVKSENLDKLIADYVKKERDAWAYAIKVLRFLKKSGFDLEPEIKTSADFEELMENDLGSYQKILNKKIISLAEGTKSFRKEGAKKAA